MRSLLLIGVLNLFLIFQIHANNLALFECDFNKIEKELYSLSLIEEKIINKDNDYRYEIDTLSIKVPKKEISGIRIPLEKVGKTYRLKAIVNDKLAFNFILDTGADNVVISPNVFITYWEAGEFTKSDLIGSHEFSIADGSTVIGLQFIIKKITIGDSVTFQNVIATVLNTPNNYSMLLGMSLLEKIGKYAIDHNDNALIINPVSIEEQPVSIEKQNKKPIETETLNLNLQDPENTFQTGSFFLGCCLGVPGVAIIYLTQEGNRDAMRSSVQGYLLGKIILTVLYIGYYILIFSQVPTTTF